MGITEQVKKNKTKWHSVQKPDVDTQEVQHDSGKQLLNCLQMGGKDIDKIVWYCTAVEEQNQKGTKYTVCTARPQVAKLV